MLMTIDLLIFSAVLLSSLELLLLVPLAGYGCAWAGHFIFEKNRPATFRFPVMSLMGDWVMFFQILTGKIALRPGQSKKSQIKPGG